jgi:hypothetical protein
MAITSDGIAPYGSPTAVLAVIEHHREKRFRGPIDHELLERAGISKSLASSQRLLQSLRLLDLTEDDGTPTEALDGLAHAPTEEFEDRLAAVIRSAYAPIFDVVEPTDGYQRVRDAFRRNTPHAQQKRMVTMFLNLCEAAGLIEAVPKQSPGPRPAAAPRPRERGAGRASKPPATAPSFVAEDIGGTLMRYPLLAGLIRKLPPDGEWTEEDRDSFQVMWEQVLDFEIDVVSPVEEE